MTALHVVPEPARCTRGTRGKPVETVGRVNVLAPSGSSPYYRFTWTWPDGSPGRTTGGRTLDRALAKARGIDAQCAQAAGGKAMTAIEDIVEDYLSSGEGRNQKTGGGWGAGQLKQQRNILTRCLRGNTGHRGMDVDRALLDRMRSQAGTRTTRKANATALRGLLRWGATQGYFTAAQAELLPANVYDLAGEIASTAAPKRRTRVRAVGESEVYVSNEDAPSPEQMVRLGEELDKRLPNGRLAVELAADAGPRWGELFQLTAHDIVVEQGKVAKKGKRKKDSVYLEINWQIDSAGKAGVDEDEDDDDDDEAPPATSTPDNRTDRRKPPKGRKTRRAGVGAVSVTGYRLHEKLLARRDEALREQAAGTNPEALLFPTVTGRMFFYTAFANDYFKPAALAAGWPHVEWVYRGFRWNQDQERWVAFEQDRVQFDLTWHSLRHRYARTCVDIRKLTAGQLMAHGGWENETVVKNLYYNAGAEHFESGLDRF